MRDLDYLKLLAKEYPTVKAASSEIINLMAIRGLPKGTEYFFSDLHGEFEAFIHLLRSASGIIREKISETFGYVISDEEEIALANLIYYPERNIRKIQKAGKFTEDWQRITIYRLVRICKEVSSKFTRSKVRKKMPPAFAYISFMWTTMMIIRKFTMTRSSTPSSTSRWVTSSSWHSAT